MADWLNLLLHIGGVIGSVAVALWITGQWLLKQITTTLTSYLTAYAQETAKIDARMERLQLLAEEQARLTRTVETIKDEIAAQAKSRDNRWEFRKEIYVNLVNSLTYLITSYGYALVAAKEAPVISPEINQRIKTALDQFLSHVYLAPLATADRVLHLIQAQVPNFVKISETDLATAEGYAEFIQILVELRQDLCAEAHNDLWPTPNLNSRLKPLQDDAPCTESVAGDV
jgi:hypothetical protein